MKIVISCIIIVLLSSIGISQSRYRTICIFDILYYDWDNRPMGVLIPVLDKQGNPMSCKCSEDSK